MGASSYVGEALSYAFVSQAAKLVLSARRMDELERVKAIAQELNALNYYRLT